MVLNGTSCSFGMVSYFCPEGERVVRLQAFELNATVAANDASGTREETWNVPSSGPNGSDTSVMVVRSSFTATRP